MISYVVISYAGTLRYSVRLTSWSFLLLHFRHNDSRTGGLDIPASSAKCARNETAPRSSSYQWAVQSSCVSSFVCVYIYYLNFSYPWPLIKIPIGPVVCSLDRRCVLQRVANREIIIDQKSCLRPSEERCVSHGARKEGARVSRENS